MRSLTSKSLSRRERLEYGVAALGRIGIGREQAIGAMGSLAGESGRDFSTTAHNPKDPNGGSYGIGQWHSDRRKGLEKFAKSSKYGINDFRTQMDYVVHELQTTHKSVVPALKSASNRSAAATVWTRRYEIPAKKYEHLDKRIQNAEYFNQLLAGKAPDKQVNPVAGAVTGLTGAIEELGNAFTGKAKNPAEDALSQATSGDGADVPTPQDRPGNPRGSYWDEPNMGAIIGSLAGGLFAGPIGSIVGGLAGQGIGRALTKIGDSYQEDADQQKQDGIFGGAGRAMEGFFGGVNDLFHNDNNRIAQEKAQKESTSYKGKDYFPDAPTPSSKSRRQSGDGGAAERAAIMSKSEQARNAVNSGKPGLF